MKILNKYRITTFILATIISSIVLYLNLFSHEQTEKIYIDQTEKIIVNLRKEFLKDTVNNVFLEIDKLRETKYNNYKKNTESRLRRFQEESYLTDEEFIEFFIIRFEEDLNSNLWTAFLWDDETGEILYNSSELEIEDASSDVEKLKSLLSSYAVIKKGDLEGIFGVSKSYIDKIVKEEVGDIIRNRKFSNDSYMWVNEVINYEGGKDYAIRRVHPNLKDSEGAYLSTDMEDVKGNLPYLQELEGIKKDGELFFTYYFKELNNTQISEKITYAKLYEDYDWIIAMGVHLDDIDAYTEKVSSEIQLLSSRSIMRLLIYIFVVLLIGFIIIFLIEKKNILTSTKTLEKIINTDTLTEASSRRVGEKNLDALFHQYRLTKESPAIMMFDIDNFKHINDRYSHNIGDIVLIEIVKAINNIIRNSDELIRWGGDEFVGIFPNLREEHIIEFGEKLLDGISSLNIPTESGTIALTVSMGFTYFKDTDKDFNDVLKRADDAMYMSKQQGKNKVNILL